MTQLVNTYGGIGSRTNVFADEKFLSHALPQLVLERYATVKPLPKNKTLTIVFRRSIPFDVTDVPLQEGVTPTPLGIQFEDVRATMKQYGDWVQISDVIADTHEDPVLAEQTELLGEKAGQTRELINWGNFRAGTSVFYASTAATPTVRTDVNAPINLSLIRKVETFLDAQYAKRITKMINPSSDYGTSAVPEGYVAIGHTDMRGDLYDIPGFTRKEKYASGSPEPNEVGSADGLRFVISAFLKPLPGAGSATLNGMRNTNAAVDVYSTIVFGQEAIGTVPLKGMNEAMIKVRNPGTIDSGDPLGQRGFVSYKMYHCSLILNQNWISRIESGATL